MSKYNCDLCQFHTDRKTDYTRHIKSKKHIEKVEEEAKNTDVIPKTHPDVEKTYKCTYCENTFSNSSSLARHKKACSDYSQIAKEGKDKDTEIKRLQKQVETYEQMLKSFTTPQTINYFNYICSNYPNPPFAISQKSHVKLLEAKTMTLIEVITMYHNNKKMVNFIGDYIIKMYKKVEPKEQSFWSTDITRLTYIISELCKNNETMWMYDKKGVKIKKIVIEPVLQYVKNELVDFCKEHGAATDEPEFSQLRAALEIIPNINDGSLADDISRYIAPEFAINISENKAIVKIN